MIEVKKVSIDIIEQVKMEVQKLRGEIVDVCPNPILREDIFDILAMYCTIVYYPLKSERNHGFHIKDDVNITNAGDFVYINTAHTLDKQVFTAAHELGHILEIAEKVCENLEKCFDDEIDDKITNLFAAELIMPKELFEKLYYNYVNIFEEVKSSTDIVEFLKVVSMLMNEFLVPYKAVVLRCFELKLINKEITQMLVEAYDDDRSMLKKVLERIILEQGHVKLLKPTEKKYIKNLSDILNSAQESGKFTDEKIVNMKKLFDLDTVEQSDVKLSIDKIKKNGIKE